MTTHDLTTRFTKKNKTFYRAQRFFLYVALFVFALTFATPLLVMITTSLKTASEIRNTSIFSLPGSLNFSAWRDAWNNACTGSYCNGLEPGLMTSIRIVIPAVAISIALGAINGFALAHWRVRSRAKINALLMLAAFVPYQVILFPLMRTLGILNLYGTISGLVIVHVILGQPILIMIFRNFYTSIPNEIVSAARMDGAGFFSIFFHIIFPLSPTIIAVAAIMQVTAIWNDFLFGLMLGGSDNIPVTVLLNNIVNTETGEARYNVNMAATLLTALPPLLIYFLSGRYFVRGITAGAVKG